MKKFLSVFIFTLILGFLSSSNLAALTLNFNSSKPTTFTLNPGIHYGTGRSNYSGDALGVGNAFSKEYHNIYGVYFNFSNEDQSIQLQPELNYIRDKFNLSDNLLKDSKKHVFHYLQLPVILKVNSPEILDTRFFVGLGFYGSTLLSSDYNIVRHFDYGYITTTGFTIHNVSFEFRHTQGAMNIANKGVLNADGVHMKNSKDILMIGFNF